MELLDKGLNWGKTREKLKRQEIEVWSFTGISCPVPFIMAHPWVHPLHPHFGMRNGTAQEAPGGREGSRTLSTYEMQRSRTNRQWQRTTRPDREQMMLNVRRKRGVIHQLTRQIPDRMLSNAPGANYWLPMTNWVCILHIFPQTMEVITDYSTALPREGGKSTGKASPEELTWTAWPWPAVICMLMTAAGSAKPQASTKTRNAWPDPWQGFLGIPRNKGWNKGKQPQLVPGQA